MPGALGCVRWRRAPTCCTAAAPRRHHPVPVPVRGGHGAFVRRLSAQLEVRLADGRDADLVHRVSPALRYCMVFEGSQDGKDWRPYTYRYQPTEVRPRRPAPPRAQTCAHMHAVRMRTRARQRLTTAPPGRSGRPRPCWPRGTRASTSWCSTWAWARAAATCSRPPSCRPPSRSLRSTRSTTSLRTACCRTVRGAACAGTRAESSRPRTADGPVARAFASRPFGVKAPRFVRGSVYGLRISRQGTRWRAGPLAACPPASPVAQRAGQVVGPNADPRLGPAAHVSGPCARRRHRSPDRSVNWRGTALVVALAPRAG